MYLIIKSILIKNISDKGSFFECSDVLTYPNKYNVWIFFSRANRDYQAYVYLVLFYKQDTHSEFFSILIYSLVAQFK
jgi:hypothetical protein